MRKARLSTAECAVVPSDDFLEMAIGIEDKDI